MSEWKDMLKPELIWFLVGLLLLLGEFVFPGLVILFFGLGAWIVALICVFADPGINAQLLIFIATSVVSLLLLRKWARGVFYGHCSDEQDLTQDRTEAIGKHVVVTEAISTKLPGKVELNGTEWSATADADIAVGEAVEIVEKDNLTLIVRKL